MSVAAAVKQYLEENHVRYDVLSHTRTYTAQDTAQAAHVRGREVAKIVVINADDRFVLAVIPAPRKVDLALLKDALEAKEIRVAAEHEFTSLFPECETGAMPPFGNLYGLDVFVDAALTNDEEIVFNASTHTDAIRMKYKEFEQLVSPKIALFASGE
jgi:Ala-tRNA(Pro) deacylase